MSHVATHQIVAGLHLVYISIYKFWPSYRAALAEQQDAPSRVLVEYRLCQAL